ncbi:ribosomal protein S18 acetylase RimI-like enzyme [Kitasatospora herbaricolor]|uniref:GNAT family N-acetyltransferase n=1 Tax=Kitasatospora herbaricolor TaxID=68217 RepID=UPI001E5E9ECF|nr:GNAT family N-acetyltransferase [Kitasatospora herbaricolor]MDQ0308344.1 ribosomal protein S18 acetylase RimI-like enzyme [Kitasatospora herbaricolor]
MTSLNPEQQQLDPRSRHQQALLAELDEFYDAVPRKGARAEDFGPLTLFVREGEGWPFYARPTLGWTGAPATAEDVRRVLARQRELGLPESFEWVAEHTPGLRAAIEQAGLAVHEHPLLVLPEGQDDGLAPDPLPDGVRARVLGADDPALASAVAAPNLAFADPGTALGKAGPAELAEAALQAVAEGAVERAAARIGAGVAAVAAVVENGSALCSGQYQRVGPVCEIVGVGTLPSARRRGLALAVTSALVADARARGVRTVFLSAADEDVARIYRRAGFRNTATALIAEPAS